MGAEGDFQQRIYKWKSGDAFADDLEREIGQFKSDKVFFSNNFEKNTLSYLWIISLLSFWKFSHR